MKHVMAICGIGAALLVVVAGCTSQEQAKQKGLGEKYEEGF